MSQQSSNKKITHSLEELFALVATLLEASPDGILIITHDGEWVEYNHKFSSMWRIPKKILQSTNEKKLMHFLQSELIDSADVFSSFNKDSADQYASVDILLFKDGRKFEAHAHPFKLGHDPLGRIWFFRDVSRRVKLEEDMQYQKTHDVLTGLPNRLALYERLRDAIQVAKEKNKKFALCVFDLNRFKIINEGLTHTVGDELLREVAMRLQSIIGEKETVARIGGDEFIVIAIEAKDIAQATEFAKNILLALKQPFSLTDHEIMTSASVGISLYPDDGETVDLLLKNADTAMYRAKALGMNRLEFYSSKMSDQSRDEFEREIEFRDALSNEQFIMHYQPQIDLKTQKVLGAEALIRWQHPVKGLIMPDGFISYAEQTGIIVPIGEWALRTACIQMKKWIDQGFELDHISVNVASAQFFQVDFARIVQNILNEVQLDPGKLEIEIVETVLIQSEKIVDTIKAIKKLGVKISLDDFGAGYSSISYLKRLPLDRLKVDRSFIEHLENSADDLEIIKAIIAMGKAFNLDVLVEGVNTAAQLEFLKKENCHAAQGYYFSEPLPQEEFERFLSQK